MSAVGFVPIRRADVEGFDGPMIAVWYQLNDWAAWRPGARRVGAHTFQLDRGQVVTTAAALAARLGFGRHVVRRCLETLERLGRIATSARPRTATVVTIKGYGATHLSSDPTPLESASRPASSIPTEQPPQPLAGSDFPSEPAAPPAATRPLDRPESKKGDREESNNSPSDVARAREEEGGAKPAEEEVTDEEADLIAHAQLRLARIAGGREVLSFVTAWRNARVGAPWLTPARVRADIDWLAAHPLARRDTKSITRVLYAKQARQEYAAWDRKMLELIGHELSRGLDLDALADRLADAAPTVEHDVMRAYVLNLGALYRPRAAALA